METLDPNEERGRSIPRMRRNWASRLMRPQTVKAFLLALAVITKVIDLASSVLKAVRD